MLCEVQKSISKSWGYDGGENLSSPQRYPASARFADDDEHYFASFWTGKNAFIDVDLRFIFLNRGLVFHGFYTPTAHTGSLLYTEKNANFTLSFSVISTER